MQITGGEFAIFLLWNPNPKYFEGFFEKKQSGAVASGILDQYGFGEYA